MEDSRVTNFTTDWTTRYVKTWTRWLQEFAGKPNIKALEVGCHEGRSSLWFCENILTGDRCRLDCVDAWVMRPETEPRFDQNTAGLPINKIKSLSVVALPKLLLENRRYSFAYVDGNHNSEFVLFDLIVAWQMIRSGGILIADDYTLTTSKLKYPPKLAIESLIACLHDSRAGHEIVGNQVAFWKA